MIGLTRILVIVSTSPTDKNAASDDMLSPPNALMISVGTKFVVRAGLHCAQMASSGFCLPRSMLCSPPTRSTSQECVVSLP